MQKSSKSKLFLSFLLVAVMAFGLFTATDVRAESDYYVYLEVHTKEMLTLNQGANFSPKMLLVKQNYSNGVNMIAEASDGRGSVAFLQDGDYNIKLIRVIDEDGNDLETLDTNVPGVYKVAVLVVSVEYPTLKTTASSTVTILGNKTADQAAPAEQAADALYAPAPPTQEGDEEVAETPLYAPTAPAKTVEAEPEQKPMAAKPTADLAATSVATPSALTLASAFLLLILRKVR